MSADLRIPEDAPRLPSLLPWLGIAACWLLVTRYQGLDHDALIYTFQALAHLHPEYYATDPYLRFGSQDSFSLFSSIYSPLVSWLGPESAAAWATLAGMLALQLAAWRFARRLFGARPALLGLAFLVVLPTEYGPYGIFRVVEPFMVPRTAAEALAVCAWIALLARRRRLCAALLAGSCAMHPLMAAPAVLVALYVGWPAQRRRLVLVAVAALAALALLGALAALDGWRIDAAWRGYFDHYAAYLFAANWSASDWMVMAAPTLTLLIGARVLEPAHSREWCAAVLGVGALGLATMLIGGEWQRLALVVQGQGYRWFWPATLVSLLVLPAVSAALWRFGSSGRATVFALAALWLTPGESFGPQVALAAALVAVLALTDLMARPYRRWLLLAGAGLLVIAAVSALNDRVMIASAPYVESHAPDAVERLRLLSAGGLIPAALLLLLSGLAAKSGWRVAHAATALLLLLACVLLTPANFRSWSQRQAPPALQAAFSPWRSAIPPGAEVVWIDKPDSAWLLLQRPSYYSVQQSLSGVFSRAAAMEMRDRADRLVPFMKADGLRDALAFAGGARGAAQPPARSLAEVCTAIGARFLVARTAWATPPLARAPAGVPAAYRALSLYGCPPGPPGS